MILAILDGIDQNILYNDQSKNKIRNRIQQKRGNLMSNILIICLTIIIVVFIGGGRGTRFGKQSKARGFGGRHTYDSTICRLCFLDDKTILGLTKQGQKKDN